jgi:histidyl-tRNA synthetase
MFGGGRYDGLVGLFGVADLPVTGVALGELTLTNFLRGWNLIPELPVDTDVVLIKLADGAEKIAAELRALGVSVAIDFGGRKLDKIIKSAVKSGVKYALFVGEDELKTSRFKLKNLDSKTEEALTVQQIADKLQKN